MLRACRWLVLLCAPMVSRGLDAQSRAFSSEPDFALGLGLYIGMRHEADRLRCE